MLGERRSSPRPFSPKEAGRANEAQTALQPSHNLFPLLQSSTRANSQWSQSTIGACQAPVAHGRVRLAKSARPQRR